MKPGRQEGFTLVELLVSLAVLSFMMMMAWTTTTGAVFARKNVELSQERDHEIRVAMSRMVCDLSSAYISANEDQGQVDRRTQFVGKSQGSIDELTFSSMAHATLWADANESEQTVITYQAESDLDDSRLTNLIRREKGRPPNDTSRSRDEPEEVDVLLRGVKTVRFEYWDWKEKDWKKQWNSTQADGERGRVPTRVRVTVEIEVEDPEGDKRELKYVTQARIVLQEELKFVTN
jgi:prepilin-type N-terminal cleavage/methylation domain-containing protein